MMWRLNGYIIIIVIVVFDVVINFTCRHGLEQGSNKFYLKLMNLMKFNTKILTHVPTTHINFFINQN